MGCTFVLKEPAGGRTVGNAGAMVGRPSMSHTLSSNVRSFGYDAVQQELWVAYRNTPGYYVYEGVPRVVHQALLAAESKGSFLHGNVLGRFSERRET